MLPIRAALAPSLRLPRPDLRRRGSRTNAESILARAEWLPEADRRLISAVYWHGQSVEQVASLTRTDPRILRRRLRITTARILTPAYAFVALHHARWKPTLRSVATRIFLHGQSIRAAARALRLTPAVIRSHRDAVYALLQEAASSSAPAAPPAALAAPPSTPIPRTIDHAA